MKPSSVALTEPATRKDLWIPGVFVAAFVATICVNITLVVYAVKTFSGLETTRPYDQGLDYNVILSEAAANAHLGWKPAIVLSKLDDQRAEISVTMRDATGGAVKGLAMRAVWVRPTNAGLDMNVSLTPLGDGSYRAEFKPSAWGNWDLRLSATRGDVHWQFSERVVLK